MAITEIEALVKQCYSTWSENYYDDYYGQRASYPPVHRELIKRVLLENRIGNVLDAGCGPASFLRELAREKIELFGFDLTPEMVEEGQRIFQRLGITKDHIWEGSVLNPDSFRSPVDQPTEGFDSAICVGVLPHVPASVDVQVIENLRNSVKDGGIVMLEARNQLFALFSSNRYSHDFIRDELVRAGQLRHAANGEADALDRSLTEFQERFRMDLPPIRRGKKDEPGYDEVLSRTHNPLLLKDQFAAAGFRDVQVLFYHFHCLPPMFEQAMPESFRRLSLAMENPHDWRGHFMASAFFVIGRRA